MKHILGTLVCITLVACAAHKTDTASATVRLKFVPGSPPSSPLESSNGAVWTALTPGMFGSEDKATLQAHMAIGDKFPVARNGGPQLFEVRLKDGNDDHLILEILSGGEPRTIDLRREKRETLTIADVSYDFYYPSSEVAASESKSTTNKAMILVSTKT